jgi:hypothetical protein
MLRNLCDDEMKNGFHNIMLYYEDVWALSALATINFSTSAINFCDQLDTEAKRYSNLKLRDTPLDAPAGLRLGHQNAPLLVSQFLLS